MSDKPSPIDKANEYFGTSGFRLVPWFNNEQKQIGYTLRHEADKEEGPDLYDIRHLDKAVVAEVGVAFFHGTAYGVQFGEKEHGLKGMGLQAALGNLRAGTITGVNNPTLEELNAKLAGLKYRVAARPEPWDGAVRGYLLEDLQSGNITWELETDDEELACILVNVLFYGIMAGGDVAMGQAWRIRALDEWQPPRGKPN